VSRERPVAVRAVLDPGRPRTLPDPADHARDHDSDLRDAPWLLYEWPRAALWPIAETVAARLSIAE
jgi:hypothetical protein